MMKRHFILTGIALLFMVVSSAAYVAYAHHAFQEIAEVANMKDEPALIPKAAKTPENKPSEAVQPAEPEKPAQVSPVKRSPEVAKPIAEPQKPKCDQSYIDSMQREIDEISALIEAKPHFEYETENGQRLQSLKTALAKYKQECGK